MKKLLFLLIITLTGNLYAQEYVPFPTENAGWNEFFSHGPDYTTPKIDTSLVQYSLQGDTIINQTSYKKLCTNTGTADNPIYSYSGAIRERDKIIYLTGSYFGENEIVLYDFNKTVGDTVWANKVIFPNGFYYVIEGIDAVMVGNEYIKRYKAHQYGTFYIIEGIGNITDGLLNHIRPIPINTGDYKWGFICFHQNNETVYLNPLFKDCNSYAKSASQPFAPIGTTWHYGTYFSFSPYVDFVKYEVTEIKDINGKSCSVIEHKNAQPICDYYHSTKDYLYEENGVVYIYIAETSTFIPLINYNTNVGDTWKMYYNIDITAKVESIETVNILGQNRKEIGVSYSTEYENLWNTTFIEGIGDLNAWFSFANYLPSTCDMVSYDGLRCYSNPDLGLYNRGITDCEYSTVGVKNETKNHIDVVAKNGQLQIESKENPISTITIIRPNGSIIMCAKNINSTIYSQTMKESGIYLCIVVLQNGQREIKKLAFLP